MSTIRNAGYRKLLVRVISAVFYLSVACMVCGSLTNAHLLAQNQQTSEQAQQLLTTSQEQNQTDHLLAIQTAEQALAIFEAAGDRAGAAQARMSIAGYQVALGNLAEGKKVFETVLAYWRQQNSRRDEAATLIELSMIEQRKGDWTNALIYLSQAQPLLNEQMDADQLGGVANSFGFLYNENGWPDLGLAQFERAREYFRRADANGRAVYRMTLWIGFTHLLRQDYEAASANINEALANLPHPLDKAQCHEFLGRLYIASAQYNVALRNLRKAMSIYETAHNMVEVARVNAMIGQVQEQQGALALARKRYLSAAQTFHRVQDKFNESAVSFALGKLEMKAGNYDQAETYFKRSVETTEALRPSSIGRDLTIAYSATVYDRYQAYIECLARKAKSQPTKALIDQALQISELARARSLAELLHETPGNLITRANPKLAQRERVLRQAIGARMDERTELLGQSLTAEAEKNDSTQFQTQLDRVEAELSGLQREHAKVIEQLRKTDPLFDELTQPTAYDSTQIQHEVIDDDQTALIEFMLGKESSYAWVVRKKRIKFYELPAEAAINAAAQNIYTLLANKPDNDTDRRLNEATEQLAQMILRPMAEELNAQRLIVVADGALHFVPFQLLPSPSGTHEPLIANHEIVNAPSASILGQLRKHNQHRRPGTKLLAAFGDPVFAANYAEHKRSGAGESLASVQMQNAVWRDLEFVGDKLDPATIQPLEFSKFELQKLSDLGGAASFVARGFEASKEVLTHLDLSQFSVLHFATHGLFDPKRPESSGLLLSMLDSAGRPQNGFITIADVYSLNAPVDLVVLSACRTGLGKDVRGEGLIGLTSGFMHAGASSVAASLWKVDDQATSELMEHFYSNMLEKSMRPADALRAAQNTLRADPRWQSPHFWAAFTLQGEYRETLRIPPVKTVQRTPAMVQNGVGIALLLMLLSGIGWGYLRSRGPRPA